jgi:hypothetical protein
MEAISGRAFPAIEWVQLSAFSSEVDTGSRKESASN